jgi:hypothetical protein
VPAAVAAGWLGRLKPLPQRRNHPWKGEDILGRSARLGEVSGLAKQVNGLANLGSSAGRFEAEIFSVVVRGSY